MDKKGSGKGSISFLSGILSKFGFRGAPEGHANAEASRSLDLVFKKVTCKRVDSGAVHDALENYDPTKFGIEHLEAGKVYVAYEYLYSSELEVRTGRNMTGEAGLKAQLGEVANVEIGVDGGIEDGDAMTSKKPVAFAMRMVRLKWADGRYNLDYDDLLDFGAEPAPAVIPHMGTVFDIAGTELDERK